MGSRLELRSHRLGKGSRGKDPCFRHLTLVNVELTSRMLVFVQLQRDKLPLISSSTRVRLATNCVVMTGVPEPSVTTGPEREESCVKKYLRYNSKSPVRSISIEFASMRSVRHLLISVSDLAPWHIQTSLIIRLLSG